MALVEAPSRVARRSAMHAVFHLAEWRPEFTDQIVAALERASAHDSEPLLSAFSKQMASDIAGKSSDHVPEPVFPEEAA
jgi:formate dehydrogenase maturation protein FdhE